MKRIIVLSIALLAMLAPLASADLMGTTMGITVDTDPDGRLGTTTGGEFLVTVKDGPLAGYSFMTFCIERDEYLTEGIHDYTATINDEAIAGGIGGGSPDPLDPRTAYLYNQWLDMDPGSKTDAMANDYQNAIWFIEEEITSYTGTLVSDAEGAINSGEWSGLGLIRVLNITDSAGNNKQDLLIRVPVPGAALLGFLGLGAAGLKLRKRV